MQILYLPERFSNFYTMNVNGVLQNALELYIQKSTFLSAKHKTSNFNECFNIFVQIMGLSEVSAIFLYNKSQWGPKIFDHIDFIIDFIFTYRALHLQKNLPFFIISFSSKNALCSFYCMFS